MTNTNIIMENMWEVEDEQEIQDDEMCILNTYIMSDCPVWHFDFEDFKDVESFIHFLKTTSDDRYQVIIDHIEQYINKRFTDVKNQNGTKIGLYLNPDIHKIFICWYNKRVEYPRNYSVFTITTNTDPETCSICLNDMEEKEKCATMCLHRHKFHKDCLDKWILTMGNDVFCPYCKTK